uniref:Uncharacterized protein n=1 Tax=Arundo donax TaxID=35708 RepID=A0A0A9EN01_ARUDO
MCQKTCLKSSAPTYRPMLLKSTMEPIPVVQACWHLLLLQDLCRLLTMYPMVHPTVVVKVRQALQLVSQ